jgi:hypothetical protein
VGRRIYLTHLGFATVEAFWAKLNWRSAFISRHRTAARPHDSCMVVEPGGGWRIQQQKMF